ncbi:M1 family metallopeptidase [Paenibacillus thiaminolyticus]|uniref:M1 family metallopeptidase n=1 Tax=Paenibacillus thiaminolyticus TaxID=49283 RepID=A0AAP9DVM4_PANTH|nr:M1 family metallopeptidase [Paenibacillus thiaminolyticus]MCY9535440.1 M1 family metallopeptidase [Paenibacillus thiaminolyticus]MCY9604862.1 M1 family metallopeptidase [Paenibacillus thiaminolyticus]MCY9610049.1 M1 family metallopeptidase [Paenibacillus thiaminolyticus]MCY9615112.1 M1 family metallopeptidase [Paenibacillus thiaminolyticus]MCY9621105.1 M1 family metallopeptidase [Paenibacillus thiaminolyticus]
MTRRKNYRPLLWITALLIVSSILYIRFWPSESVPSLGSDMPKNIAMEPVTPQNIESPAAEVLSERIAEYHINVRLDESAHLLQAAQTVTWLNPGKKTVNELYFHLYPNAFESPDTTFMRESGGRLREDAMPGDGYGGISLTALDTTDGLSLMNRIEYVQPDDGNAKDKTLIKIRLPQPVKSYERITLTMKFEVKLPKIFARMGYAEDFVMAGQWFPKVAAYEKVGVRGRSSEGWNLHQYHGNSEFYANYGIYSVKIEVPDTYTVAATGFPTKTPILANGRKTYQFYADDVHDFGWAASPNFIYVEEPFSAPNVPGVRIKLYLDPKHENLKERYLYAAKAALSKFSEWYGSYPYSTLSIVVPPKAANGAGGMEYPTLITAFGAEDDSPGYNLERTVVHEIGHQYFYGLLASNEFEEAWLDEGFTSYAEDKLMEHEFGVAPNLAVEGSYMTDPAPLKLAAWEYKDHRHYAENVYMRSKLVLLAIEKQVGEKTMHRIMRTYTQKYRFKHPTTADFQRVVEQVTKRKWTDFFNQYVYGNQMADFAVEGIDTRVLDNEGAPRYEATVHIVKKGADYPSVPIVFHFADGTSTRKVWNGDGERMQYRLNHTAPLDWVMIDPLYTIVVENKHINNYMKAHVEEPVRTRVNLSIVKLLEMISSAVGW